MFDADKNTLLPDNRTTFERGYEEGIKALVQSLEVSNWINDPLKTKAELLDLMAVENGVLDWYQSDSEEAKRKSISNAFHIQQSAGTQQGLIDALEALNITTQITKGDLPYSLCVEAITNEQLTDDFIFRLRNRVEVYKSERDSFSLAVRYTAKNQMFVGGVIQIVHKPIFTQN